MVNRYDTSDHWGFILTVTYFYGFYVKTSFAAINEQVNAYDLVGECVVLQGSNRPSEIQQFIDKVNQHMPQINKSDAVVTITAAAIGADKNLPVGMGRSLKMCLQQLETKIDKLNRNW